MTAWVPRAVHLKLTAAIAPWQRIFVPCPFHFTVSAALGYSAQNAVNLVTRQDRVLLANMPVTWKDETLTITASCGVSVAMPSEIDSQALIGRAHVALCRAKDQGRNCVRLSLETAVA
jgi:GGDEF domain-containing protein